jgi:hypothetical protein
MIQRKQTLWLLGSIVFSILLFFMPYALQQQSMLNDTTISEIPLSARNNIVLSIASICLSALCAVCIFMFKNRPLQILLCWLIILLGIGIFAYQLVDGYQTHLGKKLIVGIYGSQLYIGSVLPLLCVFFTALALVGIRSDDRLIRDADRLR